MTLWWIGNAVLLVVVLPVVVILLTGLLRQVLRLNKVADDLLVHGTGCSQQLDAVPKLVQTQQLVSSARGLVGRYSTALLRMLGLVK